MLVRLIPIPVETVTIRVREMDDGYPVAPLPGLSRRQFILIGHRLKKIIAQLTNRYSIDSYSFKYSSADLPQSFWLLKAL